MTEVTTLTKLGTNAFASTTGYNANIDAIVEAFGETLSRKNTSGNQMETILDMNSNKIINLPEPINQNEPATVKFVQDLLAEITASSTGVTVVQGRLLRALLAAGLLPVDTVSSPTPPADTSLIWIDESTDPEQLKAYKNGFWQTAIFDDIYSGAFYSAAAGILIESRVQALEQNVSPSPVWRNPIPDTRLTVGTPLAAIDLSLRVEDPDHSPSELNYSASALPTGVFLSGTIIQGTPTTSGTFYSQISAVDPDNNQGSFWTQFIVESDDGTNPPRWINRLVDRSEALNTTINIQLETRVADSDTLVENLTFSASGLPTGITFNEITNTLEGSPTVEGTFTTTLAVSDGSSTDSHAFFWTIVDTSNTGLPDTRPPGNDVGGISGYDVRVIVN